MINPLSLDNEEILQFTLDGKFHIWPLVRFDLLTALSRNSAPSSTRRQVSVATRLWNLLRGLSGVKFKRSPIQFISSTLFCIKQSDGYVNVLEDYFCEVYPDKSFVYENLDPINYSRRLPRKSPNISTAFTYIDLVGKGVARFFPATSNNDIAAFCQYLVDKGISSELVDDVKKKLGRYARQLKSQQFVYRLFLKLSSPRLLFINCAAYGAANAVLISEARKLGISTAEMQHGVIDASHYAYNYGDDVVNSGTYKNYLPDHLLTFGEYWHGCMNNSCIKTSVGHPHLSRIRNQFVEAGEPGSFLVISQWTITEQLINAVIKIRQAHPKARIKYRLHPVESLTDQQQQLLITNDIEISDCHSDIYSEFGLFENIVGCYSTALYEARAFGKKIFVMRHPLASQYGFDKVGVVFDDPQDFEDASLRGRTDQHESTYFYEDDFDRRYKSFVVKCRLEA